LKEVPAPTPEVGRPIEAGNYMPNNSQTKMGPFSVVSDGKCRTPNLRLFQQFLSQRQLSSRAPGQKHAKGSSSFLRFRSVTLTLDLPIIGQSNSSWTGSSVLVISNSKTLSPSRSRPTSRRFNAKLRRQRSNSTWPRSGCCFPGDESGAGSQDREILADRRENAGIR